jgi:hypothetical protein
MPPTYTTRIFINLGSALRRQCEKMGSPNILDRAIEINEQAMKSTPANQRDVPQHSNKFITESIREDRIKEGF